MILLFGDKATKNANSSKANSVKNNNPVENSGILAMNSTGSKGLLTVNQYDSYISNNPVTIDYAMYANYEFTDSESSGFMGDFSAAVAVLGDCGFAGADCGGASFSSCSSGSSCSSFASVC